MQRRMSNSQAEFAKMMETREKAAAAAASGNRRSSERRRSSEVLSDMMKGKLMRASSVYALRLMQNAPFTHWFEGEEDFRQLARIFILHHFVPGETLPESPFYMVASGSVTVHTEQGTHAPVSHETAEFFMACTARADVEKRPMSRGLLACFGGGGWDDIDHDAHDERYDDDDDGHAHVHGGHHNHHTPSVAVRAKVDPKGPAAAGVGPAGAPSAGHRFTSEPKDASSQ